MFYAALVVAWFCLLGFLTGWAWAEIRHIDKETNDAYDDYFWPYKDGFDRGWEEAIKWVKGMEEPEGETKE